MKPLLSAFKGFSHKKIERLKHLQVHYYWWSFKASSISMTIAGYNFFSCFFCLFLCLCFFSRMFYGISFSWTASYLACSLWPAVLWLFHWSANLPDEKVIRLSSVTASTSHHQMLDIILALIFSQLPHPECWMPHSHWRLSIAFGLLCLLGSRCSPWFLCLC